MSSRKHRREKAWMKDNHCHFCGISTILIRTEGMKKDCPDNMAVLYHDRNKFDPKRSEPSNGKEIRNKLVCWKCAREKSKESQASQPLEVLHERSNQKQFSIDNIIRVWTDERNNEVRRSIKHLIRTNWKSLAGVLDKLVEEEWQKKIFSNFNDNEPS